MFRMWIDEMDATWAKFPGLVYARKEDRRQVDEAISRADLNTMIQRGAHGMCRVDLRRFMSKLRRERAAHGTGFAVNPLVLYSVASSRTCPRSVLATLFRWRLEDAAAGVPWAWPDSAEDMLKAHGHSPAELLQTHSPAAQSYNLEMEAEEPGGGWLPHRSSVQLARILRARLAEGSALRRALTQFITAANAASFRALVAAVNAPGFARGLAPPGMQAATTCAPAHAPPAGA